SNFTSRLGELGDLRQKIVRGVEVLVEGYPASITVELDVARPRHDASATMVCHRHERASAFEDDCAVLSCGFFKTPDECSGRCPLAVATPLSKRTGVIPVWATLFRRGFLCRAGVSVSRESTHDCVKPVST